MAAKRDVSGIFEAELNRAPGRKAAVLDSAFHLSKTGITFFTETRLPEWTEIGVELRLPAATHLKDRTISCRGVVVQCVRRLHGKGFEVSVVFLDLPKNVQLDLAIPTATVNLAHLSIGH